MRTVSLPLVVVALLLTAIVPGRADEFKPAYLQLTQLDRETYEVLWKVPAIDESTASNMVRSSRSIWPGITESTR